MAKLLKSYSDFSGGMNADAAPDSLADNELREGVNIDLGERGGFSTRLGTAPLMFTGTCPAQTGMSTTQVKLSSSASAVDDYYNNRIIVIVSGTGAGQDRVISDYDGTTQVATVAIGWLTHPDSTSVFQVVRKHSSNVLEIMLWERVDGSTVTMAIIGAGLYKINILDGTETLVQAFYSEFIGSPPFGWFVHQDKFYFTGKSGASTYKYWVYDGTTVAEVVANTGSGNDLSPIKKCNKFIWHPKSMRIFAAGNPDNKNCIYYSESNDPTYFKSTSTVYPSTADGPVNNLEPFGASMVATYYNGWWAWEGVDPATDATWERLAITQGSINGKVVTLVPNGLSFVGVGGIYVISPTVLDYSVVMITGNEIIRDLTNGKVSSIVKDIGYKVATRAMYDQYNNRYMMAYTSAGELVNDKMLVLDWDLKSFVVYDGISANHMVQLNDGTILVASGKYILKMDQDCDDWDIVNDNYKPIHWKAQTKDYSMGYPFNIKKFSKILFAASQDIDDMSVTDIEVQCDYKTVEIDDIDISSVFAWGSEWGNDWGWSNLIEREIKISARGNRISVTFDRNVAGERATIYGVAFMFKRKKPKGVRVEYEV